MAAYTSTFRPLINWGGSFIINDIYRPLDPHASAKREIWVSRLTTLVLFIAASLVAILYVKHMESWFLYINLAMVMFFLPLSVFRFFWWRFNVWGELAAVVLGLPLSILVWFVLDFQNAEKHPMWQGLGLLFGLSFLVLLIVTLLTPAESPETLRRFFIVAGRPVFGGRSADRRSRRRWKSFRWAAGMELPAGHTGLPGNRFGHQRGVFVRLDDDVGRHGHDHRVAARGLFIA